jgi:pyrroloquinoline quinone (PQQ) biosynthesis protein C
MHLEADEEHAGRAIELIRRYCTTEGQLDKCKAAVKEVLDATAVVAGGMERVCAA